MGIKQSLEKFLRGGNGKSFELGDVEKATLDDVINDGVVSIRLGGTTVTREVAMKLTALNQGINLISDSVASLPVYLYKRNADGSRVRVDDYRNTLLNIENSPNSTAYNMKKNWTMDFILHGNGYLDICKDHRGNITSLIHIPHGEIELIDVNPINKRECSYKYSYWGMTNESFEVLNLVRNPIRNEVTGVGILEEGSMSLEGAYGLDEYSKNVNSNGFNAIQLDSLVGTISTISSNVHSRAVQIFTSTSLDTVAPSFFIFARVAGLIPAFAASSLLFISRSISNLKSFL